MKKNTGCNLPAQIDLLATDGEAYEFLFVAKEVVLSTRPFFTKRPKRPGIRRILKNLSKKWALLGPLLVPYHISFVIGGTSQRRI